ncbi:MAG TPA: HPr family phosphocarrier protein [Candidatus Flavonifractor merdigallinarum]|uniref:HPr family phosphocarrier protein n=1 Tax=Candidatus Flavonifractor merdigallinarum TaxID=2838589 RepID=A0A9D1Y9W6_9FIRM|nr:HPr family phosphocarrier protein [Candidatus Flavonifractor merdigallinarum]
MKEFRYVIQDPLGIHARPAGLFVKAFKPFADTEVTITKGDKTVKATQLMKLMGLAVKQGDEVVITANGPQEDAAIATAEEFLKTNL